MVDDLDPYDAPEGFVPPDPVHPDDVARLKSLASTGLSLDENEPQYDAIVELAEALFEVPICLISIVTESRQWFKACIGLDVRETPRSSAFCAHAILPDVTDVFMVTDAREDPRFCDNPLVTGAPHIRFYAGAPLVWQGHKIGTVCVIDTKPRELTASLQQKLIKLAALAAGHMHTRLQARQLQEANAALQLQTERLHALIDTANAPIFAVDQQLRVSVWNNKIAELLSLPKRDAVGRKVDELGPLVGAEGGADAPARAAGAEGTPAATLAALRTFQDVLARGLDGEACACVGLELPPSAAQPDGVELQLSVAPQWDDARAAVTAVVCVAEDVRARNQIMRAKVETVRLQEVNEAKDAFLACMSHEMRTPLNGLLGMLQLAMVADDVPPKVRRCVKQAKNSAVLLLSLINDILDITRIETGQLTLDATPFALRPTLDEVVELVRPKATEKGLDLKLDLDSSLEGAAVVGDSKRIQQVLNNLMWNALKFTLEGRVELRARRHPDGDLTLVVMDTGVGIAKEEQQTVFERGFSGKGGRRADRSGAGLGLTICSQLVSLMRGTITLQSQVGVGTIVTVKLPLAAAPSGADTAVPPPSSATAGGLSPALKSRLPPRRVLLVEDNPYNVDVAKQMLETMGHTVVVAVNGLEAVNLVVATAGGGGSGGDDAKRPFDIVLMDCDMPVMDGYEAARQIRQLESRAEIPSGGPSSKALPIIAVTAHAMTGDRDKCFDAGMDDYVTKPVMLLALHEKIAAHTKSSSGGGANPGLPLERSRSDLDNPLVASLKERSQPTSPPPAPVFASTQAPPLFGGGGDAAATGTTASPRSADGDGDADAEPPLHVANLRDVFGGDERLMRMALTKYDPAFTAQLAPLLAGGAWVDLGRAAHKAKGTLSYLCAHTAKARAYTLEKAAKALAAADAPTDEPTRAKMREATADALRLLELETQRVGPAVLALLETIPAA